MLDILRNNSDIMKLWYYRKHMPFPVPSAAPCRNVLDILRNNSRLEALYAMGANRAFQFCLHYKRTTEFRRLCDILRNHLSNLIK